MSPAEIRAATSLAGIFSLRMLGLFMILPVLSLYADQFSGSTPFLLGLALGAYGLTQALFQIPFGMLSDRIGRKPVITAGLLIFALGSVVAALSDSIAGVILGRALQGSGAIAAAVLALNADLTSEENRTKAMAIIGISIGAAFAIAIIAGPALSSWVGIHGIFWVTAGLALGGIVILKFWVPDPAHSRLHRDAELVPAQLGHVLGDAQLLRLNFGILTLHTVLTASFVMLPLALRDGVGLAVGDHWQVYLPVLLLSVAGMVPFFMAEKRGHMKPVFSGAVLLLTFAVAGLGLLNESLTGIVVMLFLFFTAINFLEASLPSLVSRVAPADKKGTALGVYSSSQFLGAFLGGAVGGWSYGQFGMTTAFLILAAVLAVWFLVTLNMARPDKLSSYVLHVGAINQEQAEVLAARLNEVSGVAEAVVLVEDGVAYLKVDNGSLDQEALQAYAVAEAG